MELDQILQLIDKVSDSSLTAFDYEAEGVRIAMEHGKAAPVQVQMSGISSGQGMQMAEMMSGMPAKESAFPERKEPGEKRLENSKKRTGENGVPAGKAGDDGNNGKDENADGREKEGVLVTSPLVGTFYAAPSEDAEPFVKVGDSVRKGQVVAIVEAMKLMNEIESEVDGVVAEVLVKNGEMVDYGKPLFRVEVC